MFLKMYWFISIVLLIINIPNAKADNCTSSKFVIPVNNTFWRTILQFNCYGSYLLSYNPSFPFDLIIQPNEYNEIDLSPNIYTLLPTTQLCPFKYVYFLDMSFNFLISLSNAFVDLKCMSSLRLIDFSNNAISTPILASDFDDGFSVQLESLNLTNNRIPYIQTAAFLSNGTSRFPKLSYLGLANNKIIAFDLLWPLTLPSPALRVDLRLNPIEKLVSELGVSFKQPAFRFSMTGQRYLDATNNKLQYLYDDNLIQYGLLTADDFKLFLSRLSNYDLRQSNNVPTFLCYCTTTTGSATVSWYQSFSNSINTNAPIYQLYCSNLLNQGSVYVFNFPCSVSYIQKLSTLTIWTIYFD